MSSLDFLCLGLVVRIQTSKIQKGCTNVDPVGLPKSQDRCWKNQNMSDNSQTQALQPHMVGFLTWLVEFDERMGGWMDG